MKKIRKMFILSVFVSIASFFHVKVFESGFIVAMSVVLFVVFIYSYEELSPLGLAFMAGIVSPFVRMAGMFMGGESLGNVAALALPDVAFFFTYGIVYTMIYSMKGVKPKNIHNFPFVICVTEILANMMEMTVRSIVVGEMLLTGNAVGVILVVGVLRTMVIQLIIIAIESYGSLLVKNENENSYKKLVVMATVFESELFIMNKNINEIEEIMKDAYELHRKLAKSGAPKELSDISLAISKNAHEVKGDYVRTIDNLKEHFVNRYDRDYISLPDLTHILKVDLNEQVQRSEKDVKLLFTCSTGINTTMHFELLNVIRNLLVNSLESLDKKNSYIMLEIKEENEDLIVKVKDNGKGMGETTKKNLFMYGFSTKFDHKTGNVHRGIGLTIVKDYVYDIFNGSIQVQGETGVGSEFVITIPKNMLMQEGRVQNELLYS